MSSKAAPAPAAPKAVKAKDASATPKATLTLKDIGSGFSTKNVVAGGTSTLRYKRGDFNASLAASDATVKNIKSLRDVVATLDYKVPKGVKGVTVNTKYELGPKKYTVGATWDGKVTNRATTVKATYSNKDNKVAGEATLAVTKTQKANLVFNQEKMISAKYTVVNNDFTYEPSYNFDKKAPAVAISKKQGKANLKLSYDLKSENAALEWNRKPFKIVLSSVVSKKPSVGKPTVAASYENVFEF